MTDFRTVWRWVAAATCWRQAGEGGRSRSTILEHGLVASEMGLRRIAHSRRVWPGQLHHTSVPIFMDSLTKQQPAKPEGDPFIHSTSTATTNQQQHLPSQKEGQFCMQCLTDRLWPCQLAQHTCNHNHYQRRQRWSNNNTHIGKLYRGHALFASAAKQGTWPSAKSPKEEQTLSTSSTLLQLGPQRMNHH